MDGPRPPPVMLQPGQVPTQEQIEQIQAHMRADAQRMGISFEEYIEQLKAAHAAQVAAQQQQMQQQQGQQQGQHQHHEHGPNCNHNHSGQQQMVQQEVQPGPPKPEAVAMANFLKSQDLKPRTCIFQENRKDMFRVKRAIRAIQSPAYEKARKKNPMLPEVTDRASAEMAFKLLPLSLLALRVQKVETGDVEHEGHTHKKPAKRIKGLWTVEIVQQQDCQDDMYFMWLYEGPQWRQRAYAVGALVLVMIFVMFPLWPLKLRQGAWYLSMAFFGVIVLFFVMAIFRLILFCITMFTHPPGLWLFPNLFEDVGFVDSFIPLWAWQQDKKAERKAKRLEREQKRPGKAASGANGSAAQTETVGSSQTATTGSDAQPAAGNATTQRQSLKASVEEADDE